MQLVEVYGKKYEFNSTEEATKFFMDCYNSCDPASSEAQRYAIILAHLFQNNMNKTNKLVTDGGV